MHGFQVSDLIRVLFVIGIVAEAMTAAVTAGRMRMDWFGVIALGALTALGGGTVRDILLGAYPLTWVEEPRYLWVVIIASVVTVRLSWLMYQLRRFFLVADAIGLAAFVVVGIQVALSQGHGFLIACVSAVTTGVSGGVMRDVLSDRIPLVFRHEMYASTAVLGTIVWWVLMRVGVTDWAIVLITLATVLATRLVSLKKGWGLPIYEYDEDEVRARDPREEVRGYVYERGRKIPGARRVYRGLRQFRRTRGSGE